MSCMSVHTWYARSCATLKNQTRHVIHLTYVVHNVWVYTFHIQSIIALNTYLIFYLFSKPQSYIIINICKKTICPQDIPVGVMAGIKHC